MENKLNKSELIVGAIFGLCFYPFVHWVALTTAPLTAVLWALSGAGHSKLYRRLGVPLAASTALFVVKGSPSVFVSVPIAFAVLCLGYGIPDQTDEGSWLGREWLHITLDPFWANIWTRATIYALLACAFIPAVIAK